MPRISIITINFNNALSLRKTISSVINQTFADYEYIIIDGGSNDGSVEVIKGYAKKITYWVSEPDKGIYNAMNKGIKKSTSKFITFLNSGDEYLTSNSLLKAHDCIQGSASFVDLFFFDYIYQSGDKKTLVSSNEVTNKYVIYNKGFGQPSTFYQRKLFDTLGLFDDSYQISGDRDFYMRAIVKNKSAFTYFQYAISVFNEGGMSTDIKYKNILQLEDKKIIDTYYSVFEKKIMKVMMLGKLISTKHIGNFLTKLLNWNLNRI